MAIKWIVALLVLGGIAWLVWWSGWLGAVPQPTPAPTATSTPAVPENTNGMSAAGDTSDTALTQDAAAVDAQMQGLTTDSANVDSSMNDKPTTQDY